MEILIDDKLYVVKVKETYMTPDKELIDEWIPLDIWCEFVRKRAISSMYFIEEAMSTISNSEIRLSKDYPDIKKSLLDINGSISRLSQNIKVEHVNEVNGGK